jgi:hypothetical protein
MRERKSQAAEVKLAKGKPGRRPVQVAPTVPPAAEKPSAWSTKPATIL